MDIATLEDFAATRSDIVLWLVACIISLLCQWSHCSFCVIWSDWQFDSQFVYEYIYFVFCMYMCVVFAGGSGSGSGTSEGSSGDDEWLEKGDIHIVQWTDQTQTELFLVHRD